MDVFFGQATRAEARVYARMAHPGAHEMRIRGTVRGPFCQHARTLPATVALHDRGVSSDDPTGPTRVAEAVLPDPCFWTPGQAYLYDVEVQAWRGEALHARTERQLAICPLGTRGRHLHLDGQRWVVRAISGCQPSPRVLEACRQTSTALVVQDPADELLDAASRQGVLLLVHCAAPAPAARELLARYIEFAAVRFVIVDDMVDEESARVAARHRVLLVQRVVNAGAAHARGAPGGSAAFRHVKGSRGDLGGVAVNKLPPDGPPPCRADALMIEASQLAAGADVGALPDIPVVVRRAVESSDDVALLRAACDRLQRDLAPAGDFAGYLV